MDRLQKKCVVVSVGLHLLLVALLIVGPAFIVPKAKPSVQVPPINFVPVRLVEDILASGGNPNVNSAPPGPAPQPPAPAPEPAPAPPPERKPVALPPPPTPKAKPLPEPEPDPEPQVRVKNPERDPHTFELPKAEKKKHKVEISTTLVKHDSDKEAKEQERIQKQKRERERARARAEAAAQAEADRLEQEHREAVNTWRRGLASALEQSSRVVGNGLNKGGTSVELMGPGGGGVPTAGFLQAIQAAYDRAWVVPDSVSDEAVAFASVTVARDGSIVSAQITRPSRNREADRSVRTALDRVKTIGAPLPESMRESQITVEIKFSVKAKRMLG